LTIIISSNPFLTSESTTLTSLSSGLSDGIITDIFIIISILPRKIHSGVFLGPLFSYITVKYFEAAPSFKAYNFLRKNHNKSVNNIKEAGF